MFHNGTVLWTVTDSFTTECPININKYPYDKQSCSIRLGNWGYSTELSDVRLPTTSGAVRFSVLWKENSLWKLIKTEAQHMIYHGYSQLIYTFHWERKAQYFEINLIAPIIMMLVVAGWLFWLPVESGEKLSLAMAILIAFSVFHSTVLENTPRTSQSIPAMGILKNSKICVINDRKHTLNQLNECIKLI